MNQPDQSMMSAAEATAALTPAGLEPPPASPFDAPPAVAEDHTGEQVEYRLNRAARRRLRAVTIADARLLGCVAKYDIEVLKTPQYGNERAATYGLEHAAKAMHRASLLSRAELHRVQIMARGRRQSLKP